MFTYCVYPFSSPTSVISGDSFYLYTIDGETGEKRRLCVRKIITSEVISHWAYAYFPGVGIAYFIGDGRLLEAADVLAERFPDAKIEKNPKMT